VHANIFIPDEFIQDVKRYLPSHLSLDDYLASIKTPLRDALRVNTLKWSVDAFKAYAQAHNWHITPIPWCEEGFWFSRPEEQLSLPIGNTDIHLSGAIYIQEASSMLPVTALMANTNLESCNVLDVAAAPGSKTSQLAAAMNNAGVLVANEYSSSRLKSLSANMQRLGIHNVLLSHYDGVVFGEYMDECFDHILLDAPCSGEGTIRKDENALKNWSLESNIDIANVQKALIKSAFHALKPGGTLVYSTCTLTPIENQDVCQFLLDTYGDAVDVVSLSDLFDGANDSVTDEGYLHVWPQLYDTEGFFIAKFKKLASVDALVQKQKKGAFPFQPFDNKQGKQFLDIIARQFGINELPGTLWQRDKELWLIPNSDNNDLIHKIKYSRIGIQIGQLHKQGVRLLHEFATCLGYLANKNVYALSSQQAIDLFHGKDIFVEQDNTQSGEVLLSLNGAIIAIGKWQGSKIKNGLARELIRSNKLISWE
jgi:16S rRNA (cytosine1407-C5)-methyltransferase